MSAILCSVKGKFIIVEENFEAAGSFDDTPDMRIDVKIGGDGYRTEVKTDHTNPNFSYEIMTRKLGANRFYRHRI